MKIYPSQLELDQLDGIGKNQWIKMRFNRNYYQPFLDSDMDAYLVPYKASAVADIVDVSNSVAIDIANSYDNLYVAMSGGIDSEWVAKTFKRNNIPFTPIIYEAEDMMSADTWWAHKWCSDNGYTPIVLKEYVFRFVRGIIDLSRDMCLRTPGGPYMMSRLLRYVNDHNGHLVTGAGFPELFPDPNLSYMNGRFFDNKLMNPDGTIKNAGWLLHEADFSLTKILEGHPWNFLSWTPDIVLSYVAHREQGTSEFNKATIFDCQPRPKAIGIPDAFWKGRNPFIEKWLRIKNRVGTSEVDFIGSTEQIIAVLTTGDIHAN